jgi:hypothetical protein
MGWDFSALICYPCPTAQVQKAIGRLEVEKVYLPLQPVIEYGKAAARNSQSPKLHRRLQVKSSKFQNRRDRGLEFDYCLVVIPWNFSIWILEFPLCGMVGLERA